MKTENAFIIIADRKKSGETVVFTYLIFESEEYAEAYTKDDPMRGHGRYRNRRIVPCTIQYEDKP